MLRISLILFIIGIIFISIGYANEYSSKTSGRSQAAQSQVAIADINWQDVASNDIHSDSHRIFEAISPGAQEDLISLREMTEAMESDGISVNYSTLDAPTFTMDEINDTNIDRKNTYTKPIGFLSSMLNNHK